MFPESNVPRPKMTALEAQGVDPAITASMSEEESDASRGSGVASAREEKRVGRRDFMFGKITRNSNKCLLKLRKERIVEADRMIY